MKNIGILGYGEVGKSIKKIYNHKSFILKVKDIEDKEKLENIEVLNVCIPYQKNFNSIVEKQIKISKPKLTIIHSTVPIGTTQKINKKLKFKFNVVHSPVIGDHPNLEKGIRTFSKFVGIDQPKMASIVAQHFEKLKLKYSIVNNSKYTEAAKLFCTSYYGICIAWHYEMNKIFKKLNLDFSFIKIWTENYNIGYKKLGKAYCNRPNLIPPKDKKIGGHCIVPNAKILNKCFNIPFIKELIKYE